MQLKWEGCNVDKISAGIRREPIIRGTCGSTKKTQISLRSVYHLLRSCSKKPTGTYGSFENPTDNCGYYFLKPADTCEYPQNFVIYLRLPAVSDTIYFHYVRRLSAVIKNSGYSCGNFVNCLRSPAGSSLIHFHTCGHASVMSVTCGHAWKSLREPTAVSQKPTGTFGSIEKTCGQLRKRENGSLGFSMHFFFWPLFFSNGGMN